MLLRVAILVLCQCVFGEIAFPDSFPKSGLETRSLQASQPVDSELKSKRTVKTEWIVMPRNVLQAVITATNEALDELEGKELSSWESYRDLCHVVERKVSDVDNERWVCIAGATNQYGAWIHYASSRYVRFSIEELQFTVFVPSEEPRQAGQESNGQVPNELRVKRQVSSDSTDVLVLQKGINTLDAENKVLKRTIRDKDVEIRKLTEKMKEFDRHSGENNVLRQELTSVKEILKTCDDELSELGQETETLKATCRTKSALVGSDCTAQLYKLQQQLIRSSGGGDDCDQTLRSVSNENQRLELLTTSLEEQLDNKVKEILRLKNSVRRCESFKGEVDQLKSTSRRTMVDERLWRSKLKTCEEEKVKCELGQASANTCDPSEELLKCRSVNAEFQEALQKLAEESELTGDENRRLQVQAQENDKTRSEQAKEIEQLTKLQQKCEEDRGVCLTLKREFAWIVRGRDECNLKNVELEAKAASCGATVGATSDRPAWIEKQLPKKK